jgi:hypothetical protein
VAQPHARSFLLVTQLEALAKADHEIRQQRMVATSCTGTFLKEIMTTNNNNNKYKDRFTEAQTLEHWLWLSTISQPFFPLIGIREAAAC